MQFKPDAAIKSVHITLFLHSQTFLLRIYISYNDWLLPVAVVLSRREAKMAAHKANQNKLAAVLPTLFYLRALLRHEQDVSLHLRVATMKNLENRTNCLPPHITHSISAYTQTDVGKQHFDIAARCRTIERWQNFPLKHDVTRRELYAGSRKALREKHVVSSFLSLDNIRTLASEQY